MSRIDPRSRTHRPEPPDPPSAPRNAPREERGPTPDARGSGAGTEADEVARADGARSGRGEAAGDSGGARRSGGGRRRPEGPGETLRDWAASTRDAFERAADVVDDGVEAVRRRGLRQTAQDLVDVARGVAGEARDIAYNSASRGLLSPTAPLERAAQRGPAAGDRTHVEVDGFAKLLVGLDANGATAGAGGKVKPFFTEETENLGGGRYRVTNSENVELLGVAELGASGRFRGLAGKYEGGLVIRASRSYETDEANVNRVLDGTRIERASDAVALATQRPIFLDSVIEPTPEQQALLRDSHVATELEIRGRDRAIFAPKLASVAGRALPGGWAPELENRLDVSRGLRLTHLPNEDAVEVSFFVGPDSTTKHNLGVDAPVGAVKGSTLSDHYNDELEITLRYDAADRQGLDRPENLLAFVDQIQGEVMPEEVRIRRTTRTFDPVGQDDGLTVFGDGTHSPSTTKETTLTIDTRGAETRHLAGLLQRDPATLQVLADRTTVEQTIERAEPERLGPADLDIGGEVKASLKKASLSLGFEAEMVSWDVVASEERSLSRREALGEILRPFPLRGEEAPSEAAAATYTVRPGDTMTGIAHDHQVGLDALIGANPQVAEPDLIFPGQALSIPGRPPPAPGPGVPPDAPASADRGAAATPADPSGSATAEPRIAGPRIAGPTVAGPEGVRTIAEDGWPDSIAPELHARAVELGQQGTPGVELMTRVMDEAFTHYSETAGYRPRDAMDATMRDIAAVFLDEGGVEAVLGPVSVTPGFARELAEQVRSLDPESMPPVADPTPAADFRPRFRDVAPGHGALGHNQIYHTTAYIVGGYATNNSGLVGAGAVLHEVEANSGVPGLNEADARVGSVGGDLGVRIRGLRSSDPSLEEARAMMTWVGAHLAEDGASWGDPGRSWNRGVDRSDEAARIDQDYRDPNLGEEIVGGLGHLSGFIPGIQEEIQRRFGG